MVKHPPLTAALALAVFGAACNNQNASSAEEATSTEQAQSSAAAGDQQAQAAGGIPAPPDVAAPPADAQKTASGLASKVLKPATGTDKPRAHDTVKVHYTGWTTDGKMFDSSVKRGTPASFPLNQVIAGWTEGLQLMAVGEKRRFWIPEELAYKGRPGAPQGMLVFDVELLDIQKMPDPPPDVAAVPEDAERTASGLAYRVLTKGTGTDKPREHDQVKVKYTGWTTDGKMFDTTERSGTPRTVKVNGLIPGWTEALTQMVPGEKRRLWVPEKLAYQGRPGAPPGMLVFDVELVETIKMPDPPQVPKDVAAPPKSAKKTKSGLRYKVLRKGTGKEHPTATSRVQVHYSGWTTDGKMFDSSVTRGQPATFPLNRVIAGWTEGLQLMVKGEKTRFWIPEELAYKGRPGKPAGMLVFDVELLDIK